MADIKQKATAALGGAKKPKLKMPEMHVRGTTNGGYIVRHVPQKPGNEDESGGDEQQEYALSDKRALLAHMAQHTPDDASTQPAAGAE